jgi:hypothetical protein
MAKKAEAKKPAKAAKEAPSQELVEVNSKAMSADVGPMIVASLADTYKVEQEAHDKLQQIERKRYDLLSNTTQAIVKAYMADDQIDPASAFSADKKTVQYLNDQIMIALGVKEYQDVKGKQKLVYAKSVAKYFPAAKDPKGDPKTQQKATLRSNFIHMLKKCQQAATAIVDNDIETELDKESGTLLISGPIVAKVFGAEEVLLNEKQTVAASNGAEPTTLKERPSFQALANIAAQDHGVVMKKRGDARVQTVTDPEVAIESLCHTLVQAVSKLKVPTERQRKALESAQSAIDKALEAE